MKQSLFVIVLACALSAFGQASETRYVGGDISVLPLYEQHNSYYKDVNNKKINDLISWLVSDCGWNTFRVRIFVNPQQLDAEGKRDPAVCQDLSYVMALGKRIKAQGAYFMLDFHYSDTWVDATHIQAPSAWKGVSDAAMADSVGAYTKKVLQTLKGNGATPDLVQVGNEIMYGLCGIKVHPYDNAGDNWDGYLGLLKAGCNAVREVCPDAQIIIHSDRPTNRSYNFYYYNKLVKGGVDYDIIGLSYYPFWHGYLTLDQVAGKSDKNNLVTAITTLATQFPEKKVQIVECAYNFNWWPSKGVNFDTRDVWACSVQGQYNFVKDLVDVLKPLENVNGINYWFPEEAGNGDDTQDWTSGKTVLIQWLNRGFWDENVSTTGHPINKTGSVSATKTADQVCAPYYMRHFLPEQSKGIEKVQRDNVQSTKELRDGQLLIHLGEHTFTTTGQRIQ